MVANGRQPRSPTPQGNTRVTGKEQFYTPRGVADRVVSRLLDAVPDAISRAWIEPSGGNGAFIDAARGAPPCPGSHGSGGP